MHGPAPQTPSHFGPSKSGLRFFPGGLPRRLPTMAALERLKGMRFGPEALFVFLGAAISGAAAPPPVAPSPTPQPSASASPSPTPRYKLIPYAFESAQERSAVPLLRFEDKAEVRALEMNAAIARFFEKSDEKGNMRRGATPGGAPTLSQMAPYRPHVTPGLDLLGAAVVVAKEIRKQIDLRKGMPAADPSPSPTPDQP